MKQGWEIKRLEELAIKLFAGGDKPKVFSEHPTGTLNIPVYANGVSLNGLVGYTDKAIVDKESITISARGTIGYCCVRKTPFVPIVRLITIIPTENIKTEFLYYALSNATIENNGVAIPQLTIPMIKGIPIPVPPIEEQERIVAELDCLSGMIEKKREQLKELDALAQSIFYQMFGDPVTNEKGWEVKKLGDIANNVNYGTSLPATERGQYTYIRMNNLTYAGYLDLCDVKKIDVSDNDKEKCIVRKGDILFNRTNSKDLVGKTAMFDLDEEMIIAGYIIRVRVNTAEVLPIYVVRYMNTPFMKTYFKNLCKGAVNQVNINSKELKAAPILIPSFELQQQFADKIEVIEKQKELIKKSISETENLFNARMDYYFN